MTVTVQRREIFKSKEITLNCSGCGEDFPHEPKQGPLPKRCPECRILPTKIGVGPPTADEVIAVRRAHKERMETLFNRFGGPMRDPYLIPPDLMDEAQEQTRRDWCMVYGRPVTFGSSV